MILSNTNQLIMDSTKLNKVKITKLKEKSLDYSSTNEYENILCRFCLQQLDDGVKILSLTYLLPFLPVYVLSSDPETLPQKVCFVCLGKMNFVKDFFTQIYNSYVEVTEDVKIFLKVDMIVDTPTLEPPADEVKDEIEEKDEGKEKEEVVEKDEIEEKGDFEEKHSVETDAGDTKISVDEKTEGSTASKTFKKKTPNRKLIVPKDLIESGRILPLKYRNFKKMSICKTATMCTCTECGQQLKNHEENLDHWQISHYKKEMFYNCIEEEKDCNFSSKSFRETKIHLKEHMFELGFHLKCSFCNKLVEKYKLPDHILHSHNNNERKFGCEECDKKFPTPRLLKEHSKLHGPIEKNFACQYCPKAFSSKGKLRHHVNLVHKKIRDYKCTLCNNQYQSIASLKYHVSSFHENKRFSCDTCGATYATSRKLKKHSDSVHNGIFQYNCDVENCSAKFNGKQFYESHMNAHQGLRPYTCITCGKGYGRKELLKRHEVSHLPKEERKGFRCKMCGDVLSSSGSLSNHKKLKHKIVK